VKKIRVSSNWDSSKNLTDRLLLQFLDNNTNLEHIEFVFDDSYDTVVFFNHITHDIKNGAKSFIFPHEPSWSGTHQKNIPDNTTILGFDCKNYNKNCLESESHTFYGGRGPWIDTLDFWSFNNLTNYKFNKTKLISSSITELDSNYGSTCLYQKRFNLLNHLKKFNFIDFYGFGQSSPRRKDSLENYKFNISIENSYENNWITEKFYDNILCETIPIYYGCKNIKEIYPEDGYILLENIDDFDYINSILKEIENNSEKIYNQKIEGLRKIKERYLNENNLLKKIIEL
jgi:hypothetical protein